MSTPTDLLNHSVRREHLAVKGEPGVGKVITMDERGELHWARIAVVDGAVRLLVDTFSGDLRYVNPKTGKVAPAGEQEAV